MAGRPLKRILIILPSLTLGGAEKQAANYARVLSKQGHKVTVVGLGKEGALVEKLKKNKTNYAHFRINGFFNFSIFQKVILLINFALFLRRFKPNIIISFTYWPNVLTGLVWRFTGANRFYWNQRSVDMQLPISRLEKLAIKLKPRYLANGLAPAQHITERHGLAEKDVTVIRNYLEGFSGHSIEEKTEISKEVRFIMIANFFPEKDHETVLRAFKLFIEDPETPCAHLHFVGNAPGMSPQEDICKALAFDLKLCGQVTFHGKVKNVKPLLQKCHIGVLSTRSEGVSNAILEYILFGLPVIATNILANRDAIGDINYPYIFDIQDHYGLYQLMKLLVTAKNFSEIAKVNFDRVTEQCNEQRFTAALSEALI